MVLEGLFEEFKAKLGAMDELHEHYDYADRYPEGLDLDPLKEKHQVVLQKLMSRALASRSAMSARFDSWNDIDKTLTAYIDLSENEQKLRDKDPRNPISIVVPVTYATLETIKTFLISAFLNPPILRYDPQDASDVVGAALLERVVAAHTHRYQLPLALISLWRDGLAYNCAAGVCIWETSYGRKKVKRTVHRFQDPLVSSIFAPMETVQEWDTVSSVLFEGNRLINIDPYQILPDVTMPLHRIQDGAHFGFTLRTNRLNVLEEESADLAMFNAQYIRHIDGRSVLFEEKPDQRDRYEVMNAYDDGIEPVDLTYFYVKLIPDDWGLGPSQYPEKWFFVVAGDRLILKAEPLDLMHDNYPIIPCTPDFDGHTLAPVSRLEMMDGMQKTVNFLYNSHFANVRKAVNDMFIIDPQVVNINDVLNPQEGLLVRIRERFWGKGRVQDAMHQFQVKDVTQAHLNMDVPNVLSLVERVTGATENLQGMRRTTSERVSATEAGHIQGNAISRLESTAKVISSMTMQPLAYLFAEHAQQFLEEGEYVKITGRYEQDLRAIFGQEASTAFAGPDQISVPYDVHEHDGTIPGSGDPAALLQLMQVAAANPMLFQTLDMTKMLMYIAKAAGAKNFQDFVISTNNTNAKLMNAQALMNGQQAGNVVPLQEAVGEGGIG